MTALAHPEPAHAPRLAHVVHARSDTRSFPTSEPPPRTSRDPPPPRTDLEKGPSTSWDDVPRSVDERAKDKPWPIRLARHFGGIRDRESFPPPLFRPLSILPQQYENYLLAFVGSFVGILGATAISYAFKDVVGFEGHTPLAVGSLGATAVLLYAVPESPLGQPRNVIGGNMIGALSGVIISQLFALNSRFDTSSTIDNTIVYQDSWTSLTPVAYALAVAIAIVAMQVSGTLHPPAASAALIASSHRTVAGRYTFLLDVFLSVTWMTVWALLINNVGRRKYPTYWWKPSKPVDKGKPPLPTINDAISKKTHDPAPRPPPPPPPPRDPDPANLDDGQEKRRR
ncbi:hypothetical protein JCM10212_005105 [Sporobolomyces blumeae]